MVVSLHLSDLVPDFLILLLVELPCRGRLQRYSQGRSRLPKGHLGRSFLLVYVERRGFITFFKQLPSFSHLLRIILVLCVEVLNGLLEVGHEGAVPSGPCSLLRIYVLWLVKVLLNAPLYLKLHVGSHVFTGLRSEVSCWVEVRTPAPSCSLGVLHAHNAPLLGPVLGGSLGAD